MTQTATLPSAPTLVPTAFFDELHKHFTSSKHEAFTPDMVVASVKCVLFEGAKRFIGLDGMQIQGVRMIAEKHNVNLPI